MFTALLATSLYISSSSSDQILYFNTIFPGFSSVFKNILTHFLNSKFVVHGSHVEIKFVGGEKKMQIRTITEMSNFVYKS